MKQIVLLLLLACSFTTTALSQKKKKKKDDVSELVSKLDTMEFRNSFGRSACECIERVSEKIADRRTMTDSISKCIDEATSPYQLAMKLLGSMKGDGDKNITIDMGGGKDYKKYYYDIERWLKDSCKRMNTLLLSNDVTTDKSLSENEEAMKLYNEGIKIMRQEDHAGALPKFKEAVQIDPHFAFAWDNLGICYRFTKKYPEALHAYRQSLGIDPEGRMPLMNIPVVFNLMGQHDSAVAAYQNILKYYPTDVEAFYGTGLTLYYYKKDAEAALPYLCKAYNIYVKEKSPYRSDAEKIIADIYADMKKDKKEEQFMKILKEHNIKPN